MGKKYFKRSNLEILTVANFNENILSRGLNLKFLKLVGSLSSELEEGRISPSLDSLQIFLTIMVMFSTRIFLVHLDVDPDPVPSMLIKIDSSVS